MEVFRLVDRPNNKVIINLDEILKKPVASMIKPHPRIINPESKAVPSSVPDKNVTAPATVKEVQRKMVFRDHDRPLEEILDAVYGDNSPFAGIVGQPHAKKKFGRVAVQALKTPSHVCNFCNFLVTGPSSVGKTTIVKAFAKIVGLPYIEISPIAIKNLNDILKIIPSAMHEKGINFVPHGGPNKYCLPPCIIFVDEAHGLKDQVQTGLLKAVENQDRMLVLENGISIDCANVCWIFATTDSGDLFGPLLNRFTEVNLKPYTRKEIAQIVQKHYPKQSMNYCEIVAMYEGRVPRKAIQFAKEMLLERSQGFKGSVRELAQQIAAENDIDEFGMHKKHLKILNILAKKPVSKDRLAIMMHVAKEELERLIMPDLLIDTDEEPALVTVCQQGYCLTDAGQYYLADREKILREREEEAQETPEQGIESIQMDDAV